MKRRPNTALFLLGALLSVAACNQAGDKPSRADTPVVDMPGRVMEVPASVDTRRDTGIVTWRFDTAPDGTLDVAGLDSLGHTRFTGGASPPDKDGITEFRILDGILQLDAKGEVVKSTLSAAASELAGRLHTDTQRYLQTTNVALSACSQAVAYYNACAIAAAVACASCVADPLTCPACLVALNFEAQARSAMNEICGSDGCGDHCVAPFTCDSGTGNCICVSSCNGFLCGQQDSCGNTCPTYDIDECGVCGGDGSTCCPYVDCNGQCGGPAYWDWCGNCIYGGNPWDCQDAG